jgi:hypothetical protein
LGALPAFPRHSTRSAHWLLLHFIMTVTHTSAAVVLCSRYVMGGGAWSCDATIRCRPSFRPLSCKKLDKIRCLWTHSSSWRAGIAQSVWWRATDWTAGVRLHVWDFSLIHSISTGSGSTQPLIQWVPRVKQPVREADHTPPSTAEIKNGGAIPPRPQTSS